MAKKQAVEPKEVLTAADQLELKDYISASMSMFQDADDLRVAHTDLTKNLAEKFGWKPNVLKKAAKAAFKRSLKDDTDQMDKVAEILELTGYSE